MIEAKTLWTDHDRFIGQASSGHALAVDAGSEKSASSPVELVLMALCACTASDVVGILRKKREPFTSLGVRATAEHAELSQGFYQHSSDLPCGGNVTHKAIEDAVRLSKDNYCSVSAMLEETAKIEFEIEYVGQPLAT